MESEIFKKIGLSLFLLLLFGWLMVIASQFSVFDVGVVHVDPVVKRSLSPNLLSGNVVGVAGEKTIPVIITLKEEENEGITTADQETIKENQQEVLAVLDVTIDSPARETVPGDIDLILTHQYTTINALAGEITADGLAKLEQNPAVESIVYDYPITISLDVSVPLVGAAAVQTLSVNGDLIQGDGETVCVIDTGIDYTHPAFGGCTTADFIAGNCAKVIGGYDIADADTDPKDSNNHGSHVAGIVASTDATYTGVAPAAKLVAVKVFPGSSGSTNVSNVIAGIDWCKNNAATYNISIITLSLGDGSQHNSDCDTDILASAANSAVDAGIFVDVASGNNGYSSGIGVPSCASKVAAVGWTSDTDAISSGSNSGLILDLLAPGTSIMSSKTGSGFMALSGTSMAAPHVAGAAALIRQYWKQAYGITLTPAEVMTTLTDNGVMLFDSRNSLTFPRIDLLAAVQPHLLFTANSVTNNSVITNPIVYLEGISDVPLSAAVVEWNYNNGTSYNYTMNLLNSTLFNYTVTDLPSGVYTYKLYGINLGGTNGVSTERMLTINTGGSGTTVPAVTITYPTGGSFVGTGSSLFTVVVTGTFTVDTVLFQFSNGTNPFTTTAQNVNGIWQAAINSELFAEGIQQLTVIANDSVGNSNTTESVLFTVDKINPALVGAEVMPSEIYRNGTILFAVNATDLYLDNASLLLETSVQGVMRNYSLAHDSGNRYSYTINGNMSIPGIYSSRFYGFDQAGNTNITDPLSVTILNRVPTATITTPNNGAIVEVGMNIPFTALGSDADNDLLIYLWNFSGTTYTGVSIGHTPTTTGALTAVVTVSDSYNQSTAVVIISVADSQPPNLTSVSYDGTVHLESDGEQVISVVTSDYSGIFTTGLTVNAVPYTANCSKSATSWACSWTLSNLTIGSKNFTISSTDNYTTLHSRSESYTFAVTSCSDGIENGDEDDLDCGGSCSLDCPSSSDDSADDAGSSSGSGGAGGSSGSSSGGAEGSSEGFITTESSEEVVEEASGNSAENPEPVDVAANSATEEPTEESSLGKITGGVVSFVTGKINKKVYSLGALVAFIMILIVTLYYVMRSGKEPLEEGKNKSSDKKQKKSSKEDYL
ncbi:MAG: S8 family serine peptidase [Nanoarchaeota archaeon]|nr:S8 family serine peptidase [Nanoarchaeota archaeon]